jgi:hypothetical protein
MVGVLPTPAPPGKGIAAIVDVIVLWFDGSFFAGAGLQPVSNYGVEFSTQLARQGQVLYESGFTGLTDWQDLQDWGLCYS